MKPVDLNGIRRKFREDHGYLNALYYLVVSCRQQLKSKLEEDTQQAAFALCVVTHPISPTQFQGVIVRMDDLRRMANDFDGFMATFHRQTIVSAHRVFATYLAEFLLEAHGAKLVNLTDTEVSRLREGFLSTKKLGGIYERLCLPVTVSDDETVRLKALVATRNVIEHNGGLVNEEYLRLTAIPGLGIGEPAPMGSKEVGEALAITECLSNSLHQRAAARWPATAS